MSPKSPRRLLAAARRLVHTDPASVAATEVMPVIDERTVPKVLDLSTRIGESMFAIGASAHEVTLAIMRVCDAYGLRGVQVDVTYNSITVSFHLSGEVWPETLVRVVRVAAPDHAKLQRVQALVSDIRGGLDLESARTAFRAIRRMPFRYQQPIVVVARAMLAVGVSILLGASPIIVGLTFIAALAAAILVGLSRLQVPLFFNQIAGGFVTTVVAVAVSALGAAGIEPFVGIRPSIIVASGIVLMLMRPHRGRCGAGCDRRLRPHRGRTHPRPHDADARRRDRHPGGPGTRQRAGVHDGPSRRPCTVRPAPGRVRGRDHHCRRGGGLQRRRRSGSSS